MDTSTGKIINVPQGSAAPHASVPLTEEEIPILRKVYNRARLRRYKNMHADDDCRSCGAKLRTHTLKQFQTCYSE